MSILLIHFCWKQYITGNPKPEIKWSKDGKEITDGGRFTISSEIDSHSLVIKDAVESDSGAYKITAVSALGDSHIIMNVTVEAKSTKPMYVTVK